MGPPQPLVAESKIDWVAPAGVDVGIFRRLREREKEGRLIQVAVVGAGFVGRGLVHQLQLTPGMRPALVINRDRERALQAWAAAGFSADSVTMSDDPDTLEDAVAASRPAATGDANVLQLLSPISVVVEATGAVEYGALVAKAALEARKHVVSVNFEADATVGHLLKRIADERGVVYTGSDGDQPGVIARLVEYVQGIGFEVVAAINCKGFMDRHATPDTIRSWAERQQTSLPMTTAFTDGTKMNIENACVANATGLSPERRGMHGVQTTMSSALKDFAETLTRAGVVDYTLGGDFGGGVAVIGRSLHPTVASSYLSYLKMGEGPWYFFYRPWHLVHFETPISIAEAVLDGQATLAPLAERVTEVVTVAKRPVAAGEQLDGIGGFTCYGEIAITSEAEGFLPIGLAENAIATRYLPQDQPIPLDAVELNETSPLIGLWRQQSSYLAS